MEPLLRFKGPRSAYSLLNYTDRHPTWEEDAERHAQRRPSNHDRPLDVPLAAVLDELLADGCDEVVWPHADALHEQHVIFWWWAEVHKRWVHDAIAEARDRDKEIVRVVKAWQRQKRAVGDVIVAIQEVSRWYSGTLTAHGLDRELEASRARSVAMDRIRDERPEVEDGEGAELVTFTRDDGVEIQRRKKRRSPGGIAKILNKERCRNPPLKMGGPWGDKWTGADVCALADHSGYGHLFPRIRITAPVKAGGPCGTSEVKFVHAHQANDGDQTYLERLETQPATRDGVPVVGRSIADESTLFDDERWADEGLLTKRLKKNRGGLSLEYRVLQKVRSADADGVRGVEALAKLLTERRVHVEPIVKQHLRAGGELVSVRPGGRGRGVLLLVADAEVLQEALTRARADGKGARAADLEARLAELVARKSPAISA